MAAEQPSAGCLERTASAALFGGSFGVVYGAVSAIWATDTGAVTGVRAWPAISKTIGVLGKHSGTFGAVGLAFGGFECLSETVRGKDDFWNGVVGGFAAGSVLAVRAGNPSAMLFTGAALAALSAATDATGRSLRGTEGILDGATPMRQRSFPID
mmetsp:Transcript_33706/g.86115  ORF Transcript_33706/g.86115 Transcript_33706/m.86115 type:complete len:155 (-) Transcript_33706:81-545(-)